MANEIDRLEIAVEAEASKANRALSGMEKRLNKIADSIEKVVSLSSSIDSIGNFDLSTFEKAQSQIDEVMASAKKLGRTNMSPRVNRADLKYAAKSVDELKEKFKDVGKNTDISDMGLPELKQKAEAAESALGRAQDRMNKKTTVEGTDKLGKTWYDLVYDIQKATNMLDVYKSRISEINAEQAKLNNFTINKGNDTPAVSRPSVASMANIPRVRESAFTRNRTGIGSALAEPDIGKFISDDTIRKTNTFEAQIQRLKSELRGLASSGYTQFDPEYDAVARELAEVTNAQRMYNKELRDTASAEYKAANSTRSTAEVFAGLKSTLNGVNKFFTGIWSGAKKAGKGLVSFAAGARSLTKTLASPISALGRLKDSLLGVQKQSGRRFGVPQMIGMSVLYSTIFGMISGIKNALKEGSDNLVQYSNAYNQSISGIMSSLSYLKNAWAAAFAPIVNAVGPYLQKFVDMVATALNAVGKFFAALTGKGFTVKAVKVMQDYGASLADTGKGASDGLDDANKAAKELQKTVMGFDELNILNDPNSGSGGSSGGSGGGGGGGGGGVSPMDMFETVPVDGALADLAKKMRDAALREDWEALGKIMADGINKGMQKVYDAINWDTVGPKITWFVNAFTRTFNSLVKYIDWDLMGRTIGAGINTIVNTLNLLIEGIDWKQLGAKFATGVNGIFTEVNFENLGRFLGNKFMIIWNILDGFVNGNGKDGGLNYALMGKKFGDGVNGIFTRVNFTTIGSVLSSALNGLAQIIQNFVNTVKWDEIASNLYNGINTFIHNTDWAGLGQSLSDLVMSLLGTIRQVIDNTDWVAFGQAIGDFLGSIDWWGIFTTVAGGILEAVKGVVSGLLDSGSGTAFLVILAAIKGIPAIFKMVDFASSAAKWVTDAATNLSNLGGLIKTGTIPGVTEGVAKIAGEGGIFSKLATGASSVVSKIGPVLGSIGSVIFSPQGLLIMGIIAGVALVVTHWDEIKEAATKVKDWVAEKWTALKDKTSEVWGKITTYLGGKWDDLKSWASTKFENIKATVSQKWDNIKTNTTEKWNSIKSGLGTIWDGLKSTAGTVFNSIKDKVKNAWSGTKTDTDSSWKGTKQSLDSTLSGMDTSVRSKMDSIKRTMSSGMQSVLSTHKNNMSQMRSATSSGMDSIENAFRNLPNKVRTAVNGMRGVGRDAAQSFADGFKSVYIPTPHIGVSSYSYHNVGHSFFATPNFDVNWYAKGGFPQMGEMFVANEKGPEMVGRMGNKNVVANNNQIATGIKNAVVQGMMEVAGLFSGNDNGKEPVFYVTVKTENDEVLARAVQRGQDKLDYRFST